MLVGKRVFDVYIGHRSFPNEKHVAHHQRVYSINIVSFNTTLTSYF